MPERDIESLGVMGWGLATAENSSVAAAAVAVAAVIGYVAIGYVAIGYVAIGWGHMPF